MLPKVLYGAGMHSGANLALSRFVKHYSGEVFTIAYSRNHECLDKIDINSDALHISLGERKKWEATFKDIPYIKTNVANFVTTLKIVEEFKPDVIISDADRFASKLSLMLQIPLWSCSPFNIAYGTDWDFKGKMRVKKRIDRFFKDSNHAVRKFIYSPFGSVQGRPRIKPDYEWLNPYYENSNLQNATTSAIADSIFLKKPHIVRGNFRDSEQYVNSFMVEQLGVGCVVGISDRDTFIRRKLESFKIQSKLDFQPWGFLHEKLYDT